MATLLALHGGSVSDEAEEDADEESLLGLHSQASTSGQQHQEKELTHHKFSELSTAPAKRYNDLLSLLYLPHHQMLTKCHPLSPALWRAFSAARECSSAACHGNGVRTGAVSADITFNRRMVLIVDHLCAQASGGRI